MTSPTTLPESLAGLLAGMEAYAHSTGLPWVTLAYAQSLDGCIAARRDTSLALSNPASMQITHHLRARHDAILVGIGTLLADDSRLDVRLVPGEDPQPVVLDNRLRFPLQARLLTQGSKSPWIMTSPQASAQKAQALQQAGARLFRPSAGRLRLLEVLQALGQEGIRSLMVEGGARIITAFLQAQLVNGIVITMAPLLVGGLHAVEKPLMKTLPTPQPAQVFPSIHPLGLHRLGDDLLVWGRPVWASTEEA